MTWMEVEILDIFGKFPKSQDDAPQIPKILEKNP